MLLCMMFVLVIVVPCCVCVCVCCDFYFFLVVVVGLPVFAEHFLKSLGPFLEGGVGLLTMGILVVRRSGRDKQDERMRGLGGNHRGMDATEWGTEVIIWHWPFKKSLFFWLSGHSV